MEILSNKDILINEFNLILKEINEMDIKNNNASNVTKNIRSKMLGLGNKIFKQWFNNNIGTGYTGYKIRFNNNDQEEILKFHNYIEKKYISCLGEVEIKRAYYRNNNISFFPIEEKYPWLKDVFLPDVKEISCYISMLEPYDMASEMLNKVGGINISASSLQKITKSIGNQLVGIENNSIENGEIKHVKDDPDLLVI